MSNQEINKNHDEFDNANPSLSATNNDSPSTGSSASSSPSTGASASTGASQDGSQELGQDSTLEPISNTPEDTQDEPKVEATAQADAVAAKMQQ